MPKGGNAMHNYEKESLDLMIKANKMKLDEILLRGEAKRAEQLKQQIMILNEIRAKIKE